MKIVAFLLVLVSSTFAQTSDNPNNWCREGIFTQNVKNFGVGFVKTSRTKFHKDDKANCPAAASCPSTAFVAKGDTIITSKTFGDYTCGWFTSSNGAVKVGWLRSGDLEFPLMLHDGSGRVWTGDWQYRSNLIKFAPDPDPSFLKVAGKAIWKGAGDNTHIGELDGRFAYSDGILKYSDGNSENDCRATIWLTMERYLIVADNGKCGGANVTFSGIYRKMRKGSKK